MAFLICGKDGAPTKEKNEKHLPGLSRHCFGLKMASSSNHQPKQMDSFSVLVKRCDNGFGFSVTGSNPARVKVVKQDSPAYFAGLRKGDRVMQINGESCATLAAESVAKIVRQCETQILLDIEREAAHKSGSLHKSSPVFTTSTTENSPQTHHKSPHTPAASNFRELSITEHSKLSVIQQLVQSEKDFLAVMQFGCRQYLSPLRHSMISSTEHATLFQNLEKIMSIAEYHVFKLDEALSACDVCDRATNLVDIVGSIYLPKVFVLLELFEQYSGGIKNALRLLSDLKQFEEFKVFLKEAVVEHGQPKMSAYLQRPLQHIQRLLMCLQSVLSLVHLYPRSSDALAQVVDAVRNSCNRINNSTSRRSRSLTSLISRSSSTRSRSSGKSSRSSTSMMSCDSSRSSVKSGDSSIESSLDPEVMQIQRRLVFSEQVQAFQLATATRHMIYAGELTHSDGEQLYVVLMSDFVLLTKLLDDDRLLVVDYPILLQDVVGTDFGSVESLNFCLTAECGIDDEWVEECDITLRAPSLEQKFTWKNILEQRIKACQTQQEFLNSENFI